ncbi:polysaccharide pyruvyl transferase family protein [bacterium C-53]|nr:polysaccharide pyruvyl transferase family protein [Lachnospiraceae bacterium]NBI01543.1 polysaccharide pyruvyl transferase family protein [Lachnospiraceae bacterium]RKJ12848.1 polysaccharide pyruvyl transferase family protein [bacterium C-53]
MGNVIITGGDLKNKGAQAMTFITVDEIKKRFPKEKIYLASGTGTIEDKKNSEPFQFEILDAAICDVKGMACGNRLLRFFLKLRYGKHVYREEYKKIWQETDALIDISGYSIGTDWGVRGSLLSALKARIASSLGAKVYYMPQSFGPCDFGGLKGSVVNLLLKRWLACADILFAREKQGYDLLVKKYGLKNVRLSCDLVLQNKGIHLLNIYKKAPCMQDLKVEKHSVAVIPNAKTFRYGREEKLMSVYQCIINDMLRRNYHIYLMYHSTEDQKICQKIKILFSDDENVILVDNELSCIEYGQTIKQFDFAIASRYHSIIHSYKEGVPCIVLGWAVKYKELLSIFGQERYAFDVRGTIDQKKILKMISEMCSGYTDNSVSVKKKLDEIQKENVFDAVEIIG